MALIPNTTRTIGRAVHLFFRCDLRVQLRGGFRVEVAEAKDPGLPDEAELARARERAELALMLRELAQALDRDEEIRPALRHLAYIEQVLKQEGLRALQRVPLDVLARAHEQLEGLVTNWEPRGLAGLRSKMAVAVMEREAQDDDDLDAQDQPLAAFAPRTASA